MELIFNPWGEFQLSQRAQLAKSTHLTSWDLLRSVQMLKRSGVQKATGSYCTYTSLEKLQPLFLSSRLKTCLWQNCKLDAWASIERPAFGQNCKLDAWASNERPALGQNTLMMMILYSISYTNVIFYVILYIILVISIIVYYSLPAIQEVPAIP